MKSVKAPRIAGEGKKRKRKEREADETGGDTSELVEHRKVSRASVIGLPSGGRDDLPSHKT